MESAVILPPDYRPSEDEEYMNEYQLEYFRQKLLKWKTNMVIEHFLMNRNITVIARKKINEY